MKELMQRAAVLDKTATLERKEVKARAVMHSYAQSNSQPKQQTTTNSNNNSNNSRGESSSSSNWRGGQAQNDEAPREKRKVLPNSEGKLFYKGARVKCYNCNELDHFSSDCKLPDKRLKKEQNGDQQSSKPSFQSKSKIHQTNVDNDYTNSTADPKPKINVVKCNIAKVGGYPFLPAKIADNNVEIPSLVDSGSNRIIVVREYLSDSVLIKPWLEGPIEGVLGMKCLPLGACDIIIQTGSHKVFVPNVIVAKRNSTPVLLGNDWKLLGQFEEVSWDQEANVSIKKNGKVEYFQNLGQGIPHTLN
jgi:Zinc knuckle